MSSEIMSPQINQMDFDDETTVNVTNDEEKPYEGTTYLLHHGDCDGWAAAAIAAGTLGANNGKKLNRQAVAYGEPFPFENLQPEDEVFIVDFSYPRVILDEIYKKVSKLVVLDHHFSMMKELEGAPYVTFDLTKSGVLLAWEYFVPEYPASDAVELLDAYDLWAKDHPKHKWIDVVKFHLACETQLKNFDFWLGLTNGYFIDPELIKLGEQKYQDFLLNVEETFLAATTVTEHIHGENVCLFSNKDNLSLISDVIYNNEEYNCPLVICYLEKETYYLLSFRGKGGTKYSPLQMAKVFGGGGHLLASGARIPKTMDMEEVADFVVSKLKRELVI